MKRKASVLLLILLISASISAQYKTRLKGDSLSAKAVKLSEVYAKFEDSEFEKCIKKILGKNTKEQVSSEEIASIKEFSCKNDVSADDLKLLFEGTKVFIGSAGDDFKISGMILGGEFVPGIFDNGEFKPGLFRDGVFVYGINFAGHFMEGILVNGKFMPGIQWKGKFMPGLYRDNNFIPGIILNGYLVPGLVLSYKFVPGTFISKTNFIPGVFKENGFIAGVFYDGTFIPGIIENGILKDGYLDRLGTGLTNEGVKSIEERDLMGGLIEKDYTTEKLGGHWIPGIGQIGGAQSSGSSSGNSGLGYIPGIGNVPTGEIGRGNVDLGDGTGDIGYIGGNNSGSSKSGYFNGGVYIGTERPDYQTSQGGIGLPPGSTGTYNPGAGKFIPNIHGDYAGMVGAKGDKTTSESSSTKKNADGGTTTVETKSETVDNGDGTSSQKTTTKTTIKDSNGNVTGTSTTTENKTVKNESNGNGSQSGNEKCGAAKPGQIQGNNGNGALIGCVVGGSVGNILGGVGAAFGCGIGAFYGSRYWKGCGGQQADPWFDGPSIPEAFTSDFYPADIDGPGGTVFQDLNAYPADIDGPGGNVFYPADWDNPGGPIFLTK